MAVVSIVKFSELEGAKRIDAEYYQPEYLEILKILNKYQTKSIGEIGKVAYGTTPEGGIFEQEGIPFVRSQNFSNLTVNTSDLVFCSGEFHDQNKKSAIKPSDILFAAVGATIGEIAVVQDEIKKGNINQNIARVRIIDKNINPYFVGFFFASKLGQLQIERFVTGNAQPYLNSKQIKSLIIPILDRKKQNEIANYFQGIQKQIKLSNSLYSQAENLLLEELGLKDFKPKYELSYTVNLSQAFGVHRIDAEYFQPAYDEVIRKISKKFSLIPLKKIFDFRRGIFISVDYYTEEKTKRPYIRIKELSGKIGIDQSKVIYINDDYPEDKVNKLYENDLIIAIIGDTIGKTNRVTNEFAGGFCSNNNGRLRILDKWKNKIIPEYTEILFQSIVVQSQIEKKKATTGQPKINDREIKTIQIPILSLEIQQKITSLVQQSHGARREAKELLEEAKRKVEEAIENEIKK